MRGDDITYPQVGRLTPSCVLVARTNVGASRKYGGYKNKNFKEKQNEKL